MKTIKTYTIDGINIPLIEVPATTAEGLGQ